MRLRTEYISKTRIRYRLSTDHQYKEREARTVRIGVEDGIMRQNFNIRPLILYQ
jgi:hypothetical protein